MICDNLDNILKYDEISEKTAKFLLSLNSQTPVGHYEIDDNVYANVDVYETKTFDNCKYEAHKKYIDIQMLLDGNERLDCTDLNKLELTEEYDDKRDIMFLENSKVMPDASFKLSPQRFVMIYPHEAHRPQMAIEKPVKVKKVVVKILEK